MASLVYFLLAAGAPNLGVRKGQVSVGGINVGLTTRSADSAESRPERVADAAASALEQQKPLTAEQREAVMKDIARAPGLMQPFLRRSVDDPGGFKRGLIETMPRMLFALLPVFAGIVALFYRGRKYPEHLYFAIHLHAFIFIVLALTQLGKYTRLTALAAAGSALAMVWILVYATLAFRRVYGGSVGKTIAKELGIGAIYTVISGIAFVLMIYWVSIAA